MNDDVAPMYHYIGPVYHYIGPVYHYIGLVYHYIGPVYRYIGLVYRYIGLVYHYGGPVYHYIGPVYHYPAALYRYTGCPARAGTRVCPAASACGWRQGPWAVGQAREPHRALGAAAIISEKLLRRWPGELFCLGLKAKPMISSLS